MSRALAAIALVLIYALTLASFHPWDLVLGAILATAVLAWARRALPLASQEARPSPGARLLRFPGFAAAVLAEVVHGTWQVAVVVAGLRPLARPGIVLIPLGERTVSGVAASGWALTLSPGEVLVDVDWQRSVMLVHLLDAGDPEAVRARHQRFYSRWQRGVFP